MHTFAIKPESSQSKLEATASEVRERDYRSLYFLEETPSLLQEISSICSPILKELERQIGVFNQFNSIHEFSNTLNLESISICEDIVRNAELGDTGLTGLACDSVSTHPDMAEKRAPEPFLKKSTFKSRNLLAGMSKSGSKRGPMLPPPKPSKSAGVREADIEEYEGA